MEKSNCFSNKRIWFLENIRVEMLLNDVVYVPYERLKCLKAKDISCPIVRFKYLYMHGLNWPDLHQVNHSPQRKTQLNNNMNSMSNHSSTRDLQGTEDPWHLHQHSTLGCLTLHRNHHNLWSFYRKKWKHKYCNQLKGIGNHWREHLWPAATNLDSSNHNSHQQHKEHSDLWTGSHDPHQHP